MSQFDRALEKTAHILQDNQPFQVITHGDVDGVAAGALAYSAFDCNIIIQKRLNLDEVDRSRFTVFLDLGSSQLNDIKKGFSTYYVVDHHPSDYYDCNCLNPWMYHIDGTRYLCAAATLYLVVRKLGTQFEKLSYLGLVGALGDRQPLEKENKRILQDAIASGVLKDNVLFDRYDLHEFVEVVNACCRNSKKELGMQVCLLERYEEGKKELEKYRKTFERDLNHLQSMWDTIEQENKGRAAVYIHDTMITKKYAGELATALARIYKKAVTILVNDEEGIKISGRAVPALVEQGMHLGKAFKGFGGGHDIAAGAFLKTEDKIETFIQITNERLYQMTAPVRVILDIPVKDADSIMKALAVDDTGYEPIKTTAEKGRIITVVKGKPGTVKNVCDDIIACIISAVQMMEGE
jgi:single-stranded DNA-specific DHH superfamily exonuclease